MMPATTPPAEPDAAAKAAEREAVLRRIAYLFRRAGPDSTMQALLRAVADYRTEK